jgi:hypothetical protein
VRNVVACLVLIPCSLVACGSDTPVATDQQYCATIKTNIAELSAPKIAVTADVAATTKLYRSIAAVAPLAVNKEWATLLASVETAATLDPNDPESQQRVADTARASQNAATSIADYTTKLCGVTIGAPPASPPPAPPTS